MAIIVSLVALFSLFYAWKFLGSTHKHLIDDVSLGHEKSGLVPLRSGLYDPSVLKTLRPWAVVLLRVGLLLAVFGYFYALTIVFPLDGPLFVPAKSDLIAYPAQ